MANPLLLQELVAQRNHEPKRETYLHPLPDYEIEVGSEVFMFANKIVVQPVRMSDNGMNALSLQCIICGLEGLHYVPKKTLLLFAVATGPSRSFKKYYENDFKLKIILACQFREMSKT